MRRKKKRFPIIEFVNFMAENECQRRADLECLLRSELHKYVRPIKKEEDGNGVMGKR